MFPNTSTQSQDLFKDCLGFARQLSQNPGLYCKFEVKLGENSFKFETGNSGKFPGKRKSPSDYKLEVILGENSFKFETGNPGKIPGKRKSPSDYRRD